MLDSTPDSTIQSELTPGERIHWVGKPDPSIIFSASDVLAIPFSLMWGGFAIFWEYMAVTATPKAHNAPGAFIYIFPLWGIPFVCIGLYMIFGRFFYKVWIKKRTTYAVTDQRILVIMEGFRRQVQAQFLNQVPAINKSIGSNGEGSLIFGNLGFGGMMYANSGMGFWGTRNSLGILGFYDIHDAEGVYQLITKIRNEKQA
jgi:hypothetical protein